MPEGRNHRSFTLNARGEELRVDCWRIGGDDNRARLFVDGEPVDEGKTGDLEHLDLAEDTERHTRVWFSITGKARRVALVEPGKSEVSKRSIPYAPPPGTRGRRIYDWGLRHPNLYAARHVAMSLAGTAAAILGVGAFIRLVLAPLIPDVDAPDLPSIDWPDWLKYLDPFRYLEPFFAWLGDLVQPILGWIPPLLDDLPELPDGVVQAVIGLIAATVVARREVRRRRRVVDELGADGGDDRDRPAGAPVDGEQGPDRAARNSGDSDDPERAEDGARPDDGPMGTGSDAG